MKKNYKILILSDSDYKPIKIYLDQMPKLAKGLIRLGHTVRHISYSSILSQMSPFKSRSLSSFLFKQKVDGKITLFAKHYKPDIVYVSFAKYLDADTIGCIRAVCPETVFVGGDGDPWPSLQEGRIETAKSLDFLIATNNGEFLDEYREAGVENSFFMPNMCDPDIDHRYNVDKKWNSDILWTGTLKHGADKEKNIREDIIQAVSDYPGAKIYGCLGMPKVEGLYYLYAISGTKIGIHVNAANNVSMYHSDRLTHYLAGGAFVLCKYVPNSELLFKNNEHLIYFHTADELEQLIDYYLKNEKERQRIADAGMKYVHQEYNSIKIGKYILEIVEQGTCKAPWKVNQS